MWPSSLLSWRESRWSGCLDQGGVPLCLPEGNNKFVGQVSAIGLRLVYHKPQTFIT